LVFLKPDPFLIQKPQNPKSMKSELRDIIIFRKWVIFCFQILYRCYRCYSCDSFQYILVFFKFGCFFKTCFLKACFYEKTDPSLKQISMIIWCFGEFGFSRSTDNLLQLVLRPLRFIKYSYPLKHGSSLERSKFKICSLKRTAFVEKRCQYRLIELWFHRISSKPVLSLKPVSSENRFCTRYECHLLSIWPWSFTKCWKSVPVYHLSSIKYHQNRNSGILIYNEYANISDYFDSNFLRFLHWSRSKSKYSKSNIQIQK